MEQLASLRSILLTEVQSLTRGSLVLTFGGNVLRAKVNSLLFLTQLSVGKGMMEKMTTDV